jgi:hypothetical protein
MTVLSLTHPFNARYAVKYHVFAIILALCRSINLTNPIRQLYTSVYSAYSCLIGLVKLIGGHSAMNLAKALIVSKKTILIIAHLCSETAVFSVLLYSLLHYCKHYSTEIAVERKQSLANLFHWYEWMNQTAGNNACWPNQTSNHRVACLVALSAVRISYWCGLALMYSILLLWIVENFKYIYTVTVFCTRKIPFHSFVSLDPSMQSMISK